MNPTIRNVTIGGIAVTVAVYLTSILGVNYANGILNHIEDIINGPNTSVVVTNNAPNWGFGLSIQSPINTSIATSSNGSAASGLASSTPYTFSVAALDGTGTTTLISYSTITTDASNTQAYPEDIVLKWTPVNGATGYAIYFGTTTNQTNTALNQYFYATTSGQFTFSTSTGSKSGSYTKLTTTAFSELMNPNGPDIFNDNINNSTSTVAASTTVIQINGTVDMVSPATTTACEFDTAGAIFFNSTNKHEWGCDGTNWNKIF